MHPNSTTLKKKKNEYHLVLEFTRRSLLTNNIVLIKLNQGNLGIVLEYQNLEESFLQTCLITLNFRPTMQSSAKYYY